MFRLSDPIVLLSLIIFLPAFGALLLCFVPKGREDFIKLFSLVITVAVFLLTVWMAIPTSPVVTVTVRCEGADRETVKTQVTEKIEEAMRKIGGVKRVRGESADGLSQVFVEVAWGADVDTIGRDVDQRLALVVGDLPPGTRAYDVEKPDIHEGSSRFFWGVGEMQHVGSLPWIPAFKIYYMLGIDGISFPLVILTSFLSMLAMWASWPIIKHVKAYCILFLLLETGMLGVFMALDFFLFYVFWEVMLLPMYFLIGIWGGPRREYAAIKFFLFTLVGSVLMLIALLILYFQSDLNRLTELPQDEYAACHVEPFVTEYSDDGEPLPVHTFNMLALAKMGQLEDSPFGETLLWGKTYGWWAFLLFFIGFVIKLPSVPVHTWLPDAHVEAPTPISMILAGVLLKMGGYGVIRICYPICPAAGFDLAPLVCGIGVVSMVYGAFAAMAQTDFKRLVAYSSVSHMGYVLLGIGVWSATSGTQYNADYWKMGVSGAMFQMIAHGLSSAGMFFLVGVVYDRVHHRDLNQFGGLFARMPVYGGLSMGIFFAAMGLPGLCGFWGEIYVVLASWKYSILLAIVAASVVILTAGYILWTLQRVFLGPEYKGPHDEALTPMTRREVAIAAPLLAFAVLLGVYPRALLDYMTPTLSATIDDLTASIQQREESGQPTADAIGLPAPDGTRGLAGEHRPEGRWPSSHHEQLPARGIFQPPASAGGYAAVASGSRRSRFEEQHHPCTSTN